LVKIYKSLVEILKNLEKFRLQVASTIRDVLADILMKEYEIKVVEKSIGCEETVIDIPYIEVSGKIPPEFFQEFKERYGIGVREIVDIYELRK